MSVPTYTKSGNKATTAAKLPKEVFGIEAVSHELLRQAYNAYLANGRTNNARTKTRGEVRGGGKKPWRQKGTGRARFGSIRVPIWRGGGITFGPTGLENYSITMPTNTKRAALRQSLSIAAKDGRITVIEDFDAKNGKVAETVKVLNKIQAKRNILLVVTEKDDNVTRATNNVSDLIVTDARYLNVYDLMNADTIVLTSKAVSVINDWLGSKKEAK